MKKKIKNIIYSIVLILLILPFIQEQLDIFKINPLKGSFKKLEEPEFSFSTYYSGEFQNKYNDYLEQNIGFRPFFIRVNNQIAFSVYDTALASWVIIGKRNYLYEKNYITAYLGKDFIGKEKIDNKIEKVKFLQDTLQKIGVKLVLIFAPGKASFYPEYIPDKYNPSEKTISNYDYYTKRCIEEGINHINFSEYFIQLKDTSRYLLVPKCGIHWSLYGVAIAIDSLKKYMEKSQNIKIPDIIWDTIEVTKDLRDTDYDIADGMNLLFTIPHQKMAYPKLLFEKNPDKIKPNVITIADSYYWNIFGAGMATQLFGNNSFWYYNKMAHNTEYSEPKKVDELNLKKEIESQDFIFLLASEINLHKFAFGFIDKAFELYSTDKEIAYYEDLIRSSPKWIAKIAKKAKEKNISLDEMIRQDAIWMKNNKGGK
ncbi:MAG: hypothetical protein KAV44_06045 [Bacteroidales bacterium]|nr:hypothetical protein [Bacteroidales bacterium]